jgi:hypothetical protein
VGGVEGRGDKEGRGEEQEERRGRRKRTRGKMRVGFKAERDIEERREGKDEGS